MLFNSLDFAVFLPIVFMLYWLLNKDTGYQNLLIVFSSYVFYGWWDWKFLSLILISTVVDFLIGLGLEYNKNLHKRKALLWLSILTNLGILCYFKYYNFFIENFETAFSIFGYEISINSLNVILPVGISFYTFQTLSYTIDVYNKKLKPTKDFVVFSAYVSFFPQLVAGPIERATNLLPQFINKRKFNYSLAVDGLRQILWGFFKKIVIADNSAQFANLIFSNSTEYSGSTLLIGALFFTFQIYCDFSGYSDIAIGTSRLFGFNLMKNFAYPYFSRDIAEFWRRWHISLSTWFRDYLYIPLGGSKVSTPKKIRNTFIIFIISGFWHGSNWTFIVWGLLNAIYFLPVLLAKRNRKNIEIVAKLSVYPNTREFLNILLTFILVVFAWIVFRSENLLHAHQIITEVLSPSLFSFPNFAGMHKALITIILIICMIIIEWIGRNQEFPIKNFGFTWNRPFRLAFYYSLIILIMIFTGNEQQFIYFQF